MFESPAVHIHRDGTAFPVEVRRTAFSYQSRACLLSVVHDVSQQVRAEQLLVQEAEVRQRERSTLLDISNTLASTLELKPDLILDQLRTIVKYAHAALFVSEDSALVAVAVRGVHKPEESPPFRIRLDSPEILARLFNEHRPIRIADVSSTEEQAQFLRSLLEQEAPKLLDGVQAWMWVPLAVKGRIIGGIGVVHAEKYYFTSHHADLALKIVADGLDAKSTKVQTVMTRKVVTCHADADLQKALDAMAEHQLRRIPVVDDDNKILGIIAQADVATRVDQPEKTAELVKEISQANAK